MDIILKSNLPHQDGAVNAIDNVLNDVNINKPMFSHMNPSIELTGERLKDNIREVQKQVHPELRGSSEISKYLNLDIKMETGERVIIVTGCINALRSRVSGTLVNMIHALLRVIKYNYCKQCMRSKDVLALQY